MPSVANVRRLGVFLSDPGVKPTVDDYDETTIPLRWGVVAGTGMWWAEIQSNLSRQERRLQDMGLQTNATRQVEIWEIDPDDPDDIRQKPLFWGEIVKQEIRLTEGVETEILIARIEPYHCGEPIMGQTVTDRTGADFVSQIDLEFNPMVDGQIIFNQWKPTGDTKKFYHWIDPEQTRTETALRFADQGGSATNEEWNLARICQTLSWLGNADETFIDNVHTSYYAVQIYGTTKVRNLVLEAGKYLPFYLSLACQKHGFNWTIDQQFDPDNPTELKPKIRFFKQQAGDEKTVKMQAPGAILDLDETNTTGLNLQIDVGTLANIVTGHGALIEREMTIPLYRTWDTYSDGLYDHEDPANPIGRQWAANEGADYKDLRGVGTDPGDPPDFGSDWMVKRRVVEDCLTLRAGKRRPAFVEYRIGIYDEWKPVPNEWGYRVLPDEISVWFTGQREAGGSSGGIPEEILDPDCELRITGTVRGDTRISHTTDASAFSPNSNPIEAVVDLSDRYFDRQRVYYGDFASVLTGEADEVDDTDDLIAHVAKLQESSELAAMNSRIVLFGLHFDDEYKVGDVITKVEGREINFNRSTSEADAKYVQIVGITYENLPGKQMTELTLSALGVA